MSRFLENILSWKPFARKRGSGRRKMRHDARITPGTDLARDRRPPVPRREVVIAVLAGMNLMATPWYYAGQDVNAQGISLALSFTAFAFLFLPVGYDEWRSVSPRRSLEALMACPPFWIGLFLMVWFALQGANPRLDVEFDGGFWQLFPRKHVAWLPSGVNAPLSMNKQPGGMNAFREMLMFGPVWLLFTALWCGVRSRRAIHWLVRGVLASALCIAVFAIGMRTAHDTMLYNTVSVSEASIYGPFLYQNQGGAFFYMAFLLSAALAFREWRASGHAGKRGGPYFVVAAAAMVFAGAAAFSASFAGIFGVVAAIVVILPVWWICRPKAGESATGVAGIVAVTALIGLLVAGLLFFSDIEPAWSKLMYKYNLLGQAKVDDRAPIRAATWDMIRENSRIFGAGAGSYRWVSPDFFARHKEFCDSAGSLVMRANYAHCDWLQMLAEWGIVGVVAVAGLIGWGVRRLWVSNVFKNAVLWPVLAACVFLMVHATFDFLFFNPAVNLLFGFCAFVTLAWARDAKV